MNEQDTPCSSICIIDDDSIDRMIIKRSLKGIDLPANFHDAHNLETALSQQLAQSPDLYIIDINLGIDSGFDVAESLLQNRHEKRSKIIFMSGVVRTEEEKIAKTMTPFPILLKPMTQDENKTFAQNVHRFLGASENL